MTRLAAAGTAAYSRTGTDVPSAAKQTHAIRNIDDRILGGQRDQAAIGRGQVQPAQNRPHHRRQPRYGRRDRQRAASRLRRAHKRVGTGPRRAHGPAAAVYGLWRVGVHALSLVPRAKAGRRITRRPPARPPGRAIAPGAVRRPAGALRTDSPPSDDGQSTLGRKAERCCPSRKKETLAPLSGLRQKPSCSHALRGNERMRRSTSPGPTQSVGEKRVPTQSVGTRKYCQTLSVVGHP